MSESRTIEEEAALLRKLIEIHVKQVDTPEALERINEYVVAQIRTEAEQALTPEEEAELDRRLALLDDPNTKFVTIEEMTQRLHARLAEQLHKQAS